MFINVIREEIIKTSRTINNRRKTGNRLLTINKRHRINRSNRPNNNDNLQVVRSKVWTDRTKADLQVPKTIIVLSSNEAVVADLGEAVVVVVAEEDNNLS